MVLLATADGHVTFISFDLSCSKKEKKDLCLCDGHGTAMYCITSLQGKDLLYRYSDGYLLRII